MYIKSRLFTETMITNQGTMHYIIDNFINIFHGYLNLNNVAYAVVFLHIDNRKHSLYQECCQGRYLNHRQTKISEINNKTMLGLTQNFMLLVG